MKTGECSIIQIGGVKNHAMIWRLFRAPTFLSDFADTTKNNAFVRRIGMAMSDEAPKQRNLDHLMEQNSTELDFLSAYGGTSLQGDGAPLLAALTRFLKAGNVEIATDSPEAISFAFGTARVMEHGCQVTLKGDNLPLVPSDVQQAGFAHGSLSKTRDQCEVVLTEWGFEQRRFIERVSEHFSHGE